MKRVVSIRIIAKFFSYSDYHNFFYFQSFSVNCVFDAIILSYYNFIWNTQFVLQSGSVWGIYLSKYGHEQWILNAHNIIIIVKRLELLLIKRYKNILYYYYYYYNVHLSEEFSWK